MYNLDILKFDGGGAPLVIVSIIFLINFVAILIKDLYAWKGIPSGPGAEEGDLSIVVSISSIVGAFGKFLKHLLESGSGV